MSTPRASHAQKALIDRLIRERAQSSDPRVASIDRTFRRDVLILTRERASKAIELLLTIHP